MERIKFPFKKKKIKRKDWKKFELNNKSIDLIVYVPHNTEEIRQTYKSKHNLTRNNQVILLMIIDGRKWHYLALTKIVCIAWRITSKHEGEFY